MNLNKMSVKNKIISALLLFFVYASAIFHFAILKPRADIKKLKTDILTQKIDLEKNLIRDKNMSVLARQLDTIAPSLEKFDQIFINSSRELEFITTLEKIANDSRVGQKITLTTEKKSSQNSYNEIPLKLSLQGEFNNIIDYLASLESLDYYIIVDSMVITGEKRTNFSSEGASNIINMDISASTYWK